MPATLETIYCAPAHGAEQASQDAARLTANIGLEGDRHAGTGVISLIEAEAVEAFNAATGLTISAGATGRNLVTRGIALNPLVGKRFHIGGVELEGTELCDPCSTLGKLLSTPEVSAAQVVKAFVDSAGLRARVITSGSIEPGSGIAADG